MPIVEDFVVNLAAGFTQTLLQHLANRALGDPQKRALQRIYQSGFEVMLRTAGQGLSQAELATVGGFVGHFLQQPGVADAFLDLGLSGAALEPQQIEERWLAAGGPQNLVNIRFDFGWAMLAFQQGFTTALVVEASQPNSPVANRVLVSRLLALQQRVGQLTTLVTRMTDAGSAFPPAAPAKPAPAPSRPSPNVAYYSCFISYSSRDQAFADQLYQDLVKTGVGCWYAPADMAIGAQVRQAIDNAISDSDKLLLILSANSIASAWVEAEAEAAFDKETRDRLLMFPIRLDDTVMRTGTAWAAHIRRTRHIGDFQQWQDPATYERALHRLLRDLQRPESTPT